MTMPDKPSRSVFVPFLIVGAVIGVLAFVVFVPILECLCEEEPYIHDNRALMAEDNGAYSWCEPCGDTGKVPLLDIWSREVEERP